jgi:hypothetical protein
MCNPICIYCGFESTDEVVSHINKVHDGGLSRYMIFFGAIPVVSEPVFRACSNALNGKVDDTIEALKQISDSDKRLIVDARTRAMPVRSQFDEYEDF